MTPRQLSRELRTGQSPHLTRRRWIIGLSMVGVAVSQAVSMYQTGVIRRLPDPPLPYIDSNKVDASDYAYKRAQTPDGFMMLINYGVTAALAGAGGQQRAAQLPWLPVALALKTLIDSGLALQLAREEWDENKALCAYCQLATLASLASAVIALPEAATALKMLSGQSDRVLFERAV